MLRLKKNRAFTLIELIVVVIIIGVLAAIAAVAYNAFIGNARSTSILATAAAWDQALTAASAQDDQTPAVEAAGPPSSTITFSSSSVNLNTVTATAGTGHEMFTLGSHYACDKFGVNAGQSGTQSIVTGSNAAAALTACNAT
jgi:prepilin-type N-terminal cleavage/methylation domain-containing protein